MKITPRRSLLVLGPLLVAAVAWGWWRGAVRVRETERELAALEARRQELVAVNRKLAREVEGLRAEREARVRAAREALDVVAPGDVLVVPPQPTPGSGLRAPGPEKKD